MLNWSRLPCRDFNYPDLSHCELSSVTIEMIRGGKTVNYALILSGGSGTRLWPLSRRARPKHLISLFGDTALFDQTLDRLDGMIPPEQRYLITVPEQAPIVRDHARGRALGIIIEPRARNNALPMALSIRMIADKDPDAVIIFLPSDHTIKHPEKLIAALDKAVQVANQGYIVTLGIPTAYCEPNYGHVHRGEPIPGFGSGEFPAYHVMQFHEKPHREIAEKYTVADDWYWNCGIFIFRADTMLQLIEEKQPELARILNEHRASLSFAKPTLENPVIDWAASSAIAAEYQNLAPQLRTSIDFALIEHATKIATVPVEMGWNDLGGFGQLADLIEPDDSGNRVASRPDCGEPHVLTPGSENVTVFPCKRTIVCFDCKDLIVVDTPDAVLILPRDSSRKVGEVVELLRLRGWNTLL
jgi:mannose-1-phosphate guanylyltransferase/mannose-6-phosphate isomerase